MYTAGLWKEIAPQDAYKSPVDLDRVIQGIFGGSSQVGYNVSFVYPTEERGGIRRRVNGSLRIAGFDVASEQDG
jgi:hypothetical protein